MDIMVGDTRREVEVITVVAMGHHLQGGLMNASSVVDLDTGHVIVLWLGEAVMVVSLLAPSLVVVVAVGIVLGDQIASMTVMMEAVMGTEIVLTAGTVVIVVVVIDLTMTLIMIDMGLLGIAFLVIGMESILTVTHRMDTAGREAMIGMVLVVVVAIVEMEGQEVSVAMRGMVHVVVAAAEDMGLVGLHVMMAVEVSGTGLGLMIDQLGVGAHHPMMLAIDVHGLRLYAYFRVACGT